jgi:xylulokinase
LLAVSAQLVMLLARRAGHAQGLHQGNPKTVTYLGLDIGSSSVKAGLLRGEKIVGRIVRSPFPRQHEGVQVEVDPTKLLAAVSRAIGELGAAAHKADVMALSVMSPAWVAMDKYGKPLTPIVTHQDRRSVAIAHELERRIGKSRCLKLAGNRPFPGGISATTWAWFCQHHRALMRQADLAGHLNTFLHRQFTGARVIDPANASFTGLYDTVGQSGWNEDLCEAVGALPRQLPRVLESNVIAGEILPAAATRFGLRAGTPVVTGIVDTSSAMLLVGAKPGQLLNVCGSTDVLGLCTAKAAPHEQLLTRALGVGKKWMSVSTLAAAGSSLNWAKDQLFADLTPAEYWKLVAALAGASKSKPTTVKFDPYLAGERTAIDQRTAAFTGLTLATTRQEMLSAVIESLAEASAARLPLLKQTKAMMHHDVVVSGGVQNGLDRILHRDWPGKWSFRTEEEATLRGLSCLIPTKQP